MNRETYRPGGRIEYIAEPVFDAIIDTGEVGAVVSIEDGWVFAAWPRSGVPRTSLFLDSDETPPADLRCRRAGFPLPGSISDALVPGSFRGSRCRAWPGAL